MIYVQKVNYLNTSIRHRYRYMSTEYTHSHRYNTTHWYKHICPQYSYNSTDIHTRYTLYNSPVEARKPKKRREHSPKIYRRLQKSRNSGNTCTCTGHTDNHHERSVLFV